MTCSIISQSTVSTRSLQASGAVKISVSLNDITRNPRAINAVSRCSFAGNRSAGLSWSISIASWRAVCPQRHSRPNAKIRLGAASAKYTRVVWNPLFGISFHSRTVSTSLYPSIAVMRCASMTVSAGEWLPGRRSKHLSSRFCRNSSAFSLNRRLASASALSISVVSTGAITAALPASLPPSSPSYMQRQRQSAGCACACRAESLQPSASG